MSITDLTMGSRSTAARIGQLANDPRFASRSDQLKSLAHAVEFPEESDGWESVDLLRAFSAESTIRIPRTGHGKFEFFVSLGAAIAVFLPVAWTWYSLSLASGAYSQLLNTGGGDGQSFLQLWVTGFDGALSSPLHQLPLMSMVSVGLILLAVGMIVFQRSVSNSRSLAEEEQHQDAEAELTESLTLATKALAFRSVTSAEDLAAVVDHSLKSLTMAHTRNAQSAEDLQTAVAGAQGALRLLQPVLRDVQSATATMSDAARSMEGSAEASKTATEAAVVQLSAQVTRSADEWRQAHLAAVNASSSSMTTASGALQQSAEGLRSVGKDLAAGIDRLTTASSAMPGLMSTAVGTGLADTVQQMQQATPALERASRDLTTTLARLDDALTANQSATQGQVTELFVTRDHLSRIVDELGKLTEAIKRSGR